MEPQFQEVVCPNCQHTFKVSVRNDLPSGTPAPTQIPTTQPEVGTTPTQPEGSVDQEQFDTPPGTSSPPSTA